MPYSQVTTTSTISVHCIKEFILFMHSATDIIHTQQARDSAGPKKNGFRALQWLTLRRTDHSHSDKDLTEITCRVSSTIRTCPKTSLFSAFCRFGFDRRQPAGILNLQKSSENSQLSGEGFENQRDNGKSLQICLVLKYKSAEIL